jgi:hypothetical protein
VWSSALQLQCGSVRDDLVLVANPSVGRHRIDDRLSRVDEHGPFAAVLIAVGQLDVVRFMFLLLTIAGLGEHPDDLIADLLRVGIQITQDARGNTLVLAHETEQDMLGADVAVAESESLTPREIENLLRARRERDLTGSDLLGRRHDAHHLGTYALHGEVQRLEDPRGQALLLTKEAQQYVLSADVVVLECPRLLLGEYDHLACSLCKPFGQNSLSFA